MACMTFFTSFFVLVFKASKTLKLMIGTHFQRFSRCPGAPKHDTKVRPIFFPNLSSGWVLVFLRHFRPSLFLLLRVSPPIVQATTHATHEQATTHLTHHSSNHNQSVSPPIIQATTSIIQATIRHTSLTHHSSNHNEPINEVIIQPFHTHTHMRHMNLTN